MVAPGHALANGPLMPRFEALDQTAAGQMRHACRPLESGPFLDRIPDDAVIVTAEVPTAVPGAGTRRFVATRDARGRYATVYAPVGRAFSVRMDRIAGRTVRA